MITSTHNPKIKQVRELLTRPARRREEQAFVVEGVRLAEEALGSGWEPLFGLFTPDLGERGQKLVQEALRKGVPLEEITPQVLRSASDTEAPQGVLLVMRLKPVELPIQPAFVLVADELRDPGNLGTLLRTAGAAGVDAVLLSPGTADAFGPKVLRSAMGAHFRLPVGTLDWPGIGQYVHGHGLKVFVADSGGGQAYDRADLTQPLALIVGGEAEGPGAEARKLAASTLHIPMPGKAESLNAAVAGAVLMFEVVRQRLNR